MNNRNGSVSALKKKSTHPPNNQNPTGELAENAYNIQYKALNSSI